MIVAKGSGIDSEFPYQNSLYWKYYSGVGLMESCLVPKTKIKEWLGIEETIENIGERCLYCNVQYAGREVQCTKCGGPR